MMLTSISALHGPGAIEGTTRPLANSRPTAGLFEVLSQNGSNAIESIKAAEALATQALSGEADVREVASAVMAAEQTLQLSMSVRDKIVTAFLELSRMQI